MDEVADVGNIIYDTETGIYVSIERIVGIRFEGETMYVTYEFSPFLSGAIMRWTKQF